MDKMPPRINYSNIKGLDKIKVFNKGESKNGRVEQAKACKFLPGDNNDYVKKILTDRKIEKENKVSVDSYMPDNVVDDDGQYVKFINDSSNDNDDMNIYTHEFKAVFRSGEYDELMLSSDIENDAANCKITSFNHVVRTIFREMKQEADQIKTELKKSGKSNDEIKICLEKMRQCDAENKTTRLADKYNKKYTEDIGGADVGDKMCTLVKKINKRMSQLLLFQSNVELSQQTKPNDKADFDKHEISRGDIGQVIHYEECPGIKIDGKLCGKPQVCIKRPAMPKRTEKLQHQKSTVSYKAQDAAMKQEKSTADASQKLAKLRELKKIISEKIKKSKSSVEIQELRQEEASLVTKISKLAADLLESNNPDIADLSDKFRPQKLVEMLGELYGDAHTDAFEVIDECMNTDAVSKKASCRGENDKIIEEALCDTLMKAYDSVSNIIDIERKKMTAEMLRQSDTKFLTLAQDVEITEMLKEKVCDPEYLASHAEVKAIAIHFPGSETARVKSRQESSYIEQCVQLVGHMVVQAPPLFLKLPKSGDVFHENGYEGVVDYARWPSLYQNGIEMKKANIVPRRKPNSTARPKPVVQPNVKKSMYERIKDQIDQVSKNRRRMQGMLKKAQDEKKSTEIIREYSKKISAYDDERSNLLSLAQRYENEISVVDCSNVNSVPKLIERFGELYDNEFSDALIEVEDNIKNDPKHEGKTTAEIEKLAVSVLFYAVKMIETKVSNFIARERARLTEVILQRDGAQTLTLLQEVEVDDELKESILDSSYLFNDDEIRGIELGLPGADKTRANNDKASKYIKECVEIVSAMVVSTPPLTLLFRNGGDQFDRRENKGYLAEGDIIDYPVWPAMVRDGKILAKGTAQGLRTK